MVRMYLFVAIMLIVCFGMGGKMYAILSLSPLPLKVDLSSFTSIDSSILPTMHVSKDNSWQETSNNNNVKASNVKKATLKIFHEYNHCYNRARNS